MKLYANPSLSGSPRGGYILRFFQKPNRVIAGSREGSEADRLAHMLFEEFYNVDSYICNTDSLACRVRDFLSGQGVTVPRDVQIIGYDGLQDYAAVRYPCSTIVQPISQMAETAVNLLFNRGGIPAPANVCLPVVYAAGGTTRDTSGGFTGF